MTRAYPGPHQFNMYSPAPLRYLLLIGDQVRVYDTYAEAEAIVNTYRTNQLAIISTQMKHGDEWQTHAQRIWKGEF